MELDATGRRPAADCHRPVVKELATKARRSRHSEGQEPKPTLGRGDRCRAVNTSVQASHNRRRTGVARQLRGAYLAAYLERRAWDLHMWSCSRPRPELAASVCAYSSP